MEKKRLLSVFVTILTVLLITAVSLIAACTQQAPAPSPAPAPKPAPVPAPAPAPAPSPAPAAKTITLRFHFDSWSGPVSVATFPYRPGGRFEQLVTQYTKGQVKLDFKERLYSNVDGILAVGDGRIELGNSLMMPISGNYPLLDFGGVPGLIGGAPNTGYEWAEAFLAPRMKELLDKYTRATGFVLIGGNVSESTNAVWTNKMVQTLSDFKGLKIRTAGLVQTTALKAVGASPMTLSMQEVDEALTRGTVDAIFTNLSFGTQRGLTDLVKYVSLWPNFGQVAPSVVAVNVKTWDSLPKDIQDGFLRAGTQLVRETAVVTEQIQLIYPQTVGASKTKIIQADKAEVAKAMVLMEQPIKEWLNMAGPLGKDVLRVAIDYGRGPTRDLIAGMVK